MGKSKKSKGSVTRPTPYGKAKVQVTFDGPTLSTQPVFARQANGHATKDKGKGKAEPVRQPAVEAAAEGFPLPSGSDTFIIIAGSYEKLLYGLEGSYSAGSSKPTLKPIFIFPAHLACVKAVAASPGGKWLATGSEDEFVKVWDLRRRKEVGSLSQHEGSITSLHFPTSSHLLTASTDSTLSLFRTSDWALLKSLKGHSGRINHVDVHPTGRVALSVGKDKTLKMWDLMRGRGASSLPLGEEAELVKFSPQGTHFAVLYPKKIEIYSLTLKLLHTLEAKSRFNTLLFALLPTGEEESEDEDEVLCVGTEKGVVEVYSVDLGDAEESEEDEAEAEGEGNGSVDVDLVATLGGHTNRVKDISAMLVNVPRTSSDSPRRTVVLTSVSSDGRIHLYDLDEIRRQDTSSTPIDPVASYDTKGTRLTCVYIAEGRKDRGRSVVTANGSAKEEVKVESDEEDEESEGEDGDLYSQDSEVDGDDGIEVELEEEEEED